MTDNTPEPIDPLANIPIVFDPNVEALQEIADSTKGITATDFKDPEKMALIVEGRKNLVKARTTIEKLGKSKREGSNAYNKRVISEENRLIAIIEPEELRLKGIEAEAKALALKEERMLQAPTRQARLKQYESVFVCTDEYLLDFDDIQFEVLFNKVVSDYNTKVADDARIAREKEVKEAEEKQALAQKVLDEERAALEKEKNQIAEAARIKKAEDDARTAEREKIERETAQKERDRIASEQKLADEKKANDEREAKEKAAKEAAEKESKLYNDWLTGLGYTEKTKADFLISKSTDGVYTLSKILGTYKPK